MGQLAAGKFFVVVENDGRRNGGQIGDVMTDVVTEVAH
jgi:hypothetical protein